MDLPKWAMRDPSKVCEHLERMREREKERSAEGRQAKARRELEKLFEEEADDERNK
ncbi:hypothetical protein [Neopusillimonas maritima]|uniref:hypothetical protein n=1 Tax=Neopusillimonas maritima TaxID=2026239 RepID=UPI0013154083|nr:hypothetical protein [Neopusillimonas maritima]